MVVVSICFTVCLVVSSLFGVALWRYLTGRMPDRPRTAAVPEEWARYRQPGQVPAVIIAELAVRQTYPALADLYETPTVPEPAHR